MRGFNGLWDALLEFYAYAIPFVLLVTALFLTLLRILKEDLDGK